MEFEHLLAAGIFAVTAATYLVFLALGRMWRRDFEAQGVSYWEAPKAERLKTLMATVWRPKLIAAMYGLAYFTNGYMKIAFSMWAPLFLITERGVDTLQAALFLGLVYAPWQWKMFLGMASDALPIRFRGRRFRRHPWFVAAGVLSLASAAVFLLNDPREMPIWTVFFPTVLALVAAGAIFDMVADAYALDVTPPEYHGRILGTFNTIGMALGGAAACLIPPLLLDAGGYQLVFLTSGLTGVLAFPFLLLREPTLEFERVISRRAIAFTFTEKVVVIAALLMLSNAIGTARLCNPTGGMFVLIMNEIVGAFTPTQAGYVALVVLLAGIPGSIVGGWAADRWGHKRLFLLSGVAFTATSFLWTTIAPGLVVWFVVLSVFTNFLQRLNAGGRMALMGDATPLALSGTVFQMYMSFSWIGNVPASLLIGTLLPVDITLLMVILSSLNVVPLILALFLHPYDAGKAIAV